MAPTKPISCSLLVALFLISSLIWPTLAQKLITATKFLDPQNKVRAKHGVPPLKWNSKLANFAKWYANQRRGDCALIHSAGELGENIFWGKGKQWTPSDAIAAWAAEESFYKYQSNKCLPNKDCSHYTQMVWRTTQMVGCAKIICKNGNSFITCNYYPHGNIIGARPF